MFKIVVLVPLVLTLLAGMRILFIEYIPFFQDLFTVVLSNFVMLIGMTEETFLVLKLFFQGVIFYIIFNFTTKL